MQHRMAKLTPFGRLLLVQRVENLGWTAVQAAEALGVSRATAYKWLRRYRKEGELLFAINVFPLDARPDLHNFYSRLSIVAFVGPRAYKVFAKKTKEITKEDFELFA